MQSEAEKKPRGAFIVLEGCDRVGKTTQCQMLGKAFTDCGNVIRLYRFPDRTTAVGQLINTCLQTKETNKQITEEVMQMLFAANRLEVMPEIKELLEGGITVICDRYVHSGAAYSVASGVKPGFTTLLDKGLIKPDLLIYIRMPAEEAIKRGDFGKERYDKVAVQKRIAQEFEKLIEPDWKICSGDQPQEDLHSVLFETSKECISKVQETPLQYL